MTFFLIFMGVHIHTYFTFVYLVIPFYRHVTLCGICFNKNILNDKVILVFREISFKVPYILFLCVFLSGISVTFTFKHMNI